MKKALLFIAIFALGAVSYSLLTTLFTGPLKENATTTPQINVPSTTVQETKDDKGSEETEVLPEDTTSLAADGSLLDGPFTLKTPGGKETGATVQIGRSPEETLLQFDGFDLDHSLASRIYFSKDLDATTHFNLAPAEMDNDVLIYGIPLDVDLSAYKYILIYDAQMEETEYYAQIQ
jgi:hypothetical protein